MALGDKFYVFGQNARGAVQYLVGSSRSHEQALELARKANAARRDNDVRIVVMEGRVVASFRNGEEVS